MYFIEINFNFSKFYAYIAEKTCRYNIKVLLNKKNVFLIKSDVTRAKDIYLEAIGIQAYFVTEIYNLGLANVGLDFPEETSQAFVNLLTVVPTIFFVI